MDSDKILLIEKLDNYYALHYKNKVKFRNLDGTSVGIGESEVKLVD